MFGKKKTETEAPFRFGDRLNQLLREASAAGVSQGAIVATLQDHADGARRNAAVNVNLSASPVLRTPFGKTKRWGHDASGKLREIIE
jgi:hypothetical protein